MLALKSFASRIDSPLVENVAMSKGSRDRIDAFDILAFEIILCSNHT